MRENVCAFRSLEKDTWQTTVTRLRTVEDRHRQALHLKP